ncbi:MAG TPA: hypothetical protein ENH32_06570 [Proteobacteria bacterium]|nr:Pilus assembly protein, PilP [bacterium BMS3Abin14]HDL53623.1 hypothetical protein [Pseudomonadota bacterium]
MRSAWQRTCACFAVFSLVVLMVLGTVACQKSSPPPSTKVPVTVKPHKKTAAAPVAREGKAEGAGVFVYNPTGFRDPFVSLIKVHKVKSPVPEEQLTPLQRVSLSDLKVEGIVSMGKKVMAQVITPDGKPYIVAVGTPIGRNRGKITRITSENIVVQEEFEDYLGRKVTQETVLRLHEKKGESL